MADFNIRSDSVDVEQIMQQIRTRIREKRGVDYTEEQVRELAAVRLERFLDPKNLRSDLMDQFRHSRPPLPEIEEPKPAPEPPPVEPPYEFDDRTLFWSHRPVLRLIRKVLAPLLKLFWNPNTLNQVLHAQAQFNIDLLKRDQRRRIEFNQGFQELKRQGQIFERSRAEWNVLYYEVLHNLVLETTRNGIELKNLRMRVDALASRLDFSERRVRALEGVVQYRPEAVRSHHRRSPDSHPGSSAKDDLGQGRGTPAQSDVGGADDTVEASSGEAASPGVPGRVTPGEGRRRRRRRRGRRPMGVAADGSGGDAAPVMGDTIDSDEPVGGPDDPEPDDNGDSES